MPRREWPSVLELRDLGVHYGRIHALRAVSLRVQTGEIVAVLGSNGAGKSTTLRAISGLLRPSGGQILLDGQPVGGLAAHRVVARGVIHCPEGRQVFPRMSVRENLLLGAHRCRDRAEVAARVERAHGLFPILRERAAQTGRHAVGRRAADAGDRPGPDGRPAAPPAGRAVARAGAPRSSRRSSAP